MLRWNRNQLRFLTFVLVSTPIFVESVQFLQSVILLAGSAGFVYHLPRLFIRFPKSFSLGEGCLVVQAAVLFISMALISLLDGRYLVQ